jgi:hypothetical protein
LKNYAVNNLRERFAFEPNTAEESEDSIEPEIAYFGYDAWIQFASANLRLALEIKVAVYKAVRYVIMGLI